MSGAPKRPPAPAEEGPRTITLAGREVTYRVRRSARARYARLRASPSIGLEVVLPEGAAASEAARLLETNQDWIFDKLDRFEAAPAEAGPHLADGSTLPFLGRSLTLAVRIEEGQPRAGLRGSTLTVTVSNPDQAILRAVIEAWFRYQARHVFAEQVADINQSFGFTYQRITIKNQRSRWGSCSAHGNLNFNWRLLLAPLSIVRYVVTHELAHLAELNHSPRFWSLVASRCPDYRTAQEWLKQHGPELGI